MYYLNMYKLAHDLKNNVVTEWEKFKYLVGGILLFNWFWQLCKPPIAKDVYQIIFFGKAIVVFNILAIVLFLYGIYNCWKINQKGNGKNFIERFVCLNFPAFIRMYITWQILLLIFSVISLIITFIFLPQITNILFLKKIGIILATISKEQHVQLMKTAEYIPTFEMLKPYLNIQLVLYFLNLFVMLCSVVFYFSWMKKSFKKIAS
ncbi:MAG: hypothetical protein WDZ41_02940 [Candidatus Babeliales bacterium]